MKTSTSTTICWFFFMGEALPERFWLAVSAKSGGGKAERHRGQAGTAARTFAGWPVWAGTRVVRRSMNACWRGSCSRRAGRALVTASVMLPRGIFPREPPGKEGPGLAGGAWKRMPHYPAHVTCSHRPAAPVTARQWDARRCGAKIGGNPPAPLRPQRVPVAFRPAESR